MVIGGAHNMQASMQSQSPNGLSRDDAEAWNQAQSASLSHSQGYGAGALQQSNGAAPTIAESLAERLERDLKIRDGAEHFLASATGAQDLRAQVYMELMAAHARIAVAYLGQPSALCVSDLVIEMLRTACALSISSNGASSTGEDPIGGSNERQHLALALYLRIASDLDGNVRVRYDLSAEELITSTLPALADAAGTDLRAAVYTLLRHALVDPPWHLVAACRMEGLDTYIVRTFLRDQRASAEKEAALKLVRAIMDTGSRSQVSATAGLEELPDLSSLVSPAVVRALASAAEQGDESLRFSYLETLAELSLLRPDELVAGGGMRCLLQAASDPANVIATELIAAFLSLIDLPATRHIFRPGFDLDTSLSALTGADTVNNAELLSTSSIVGTMLKSWPGLLYLCLQDCAALRALLTSLAVNAGDVQSEILNILQDFFARGDELKLGLERKSPHIPRFRPLDIPAKASRISLIQSYQLLVAHILLNCGVMESLISIIQKRPSLTDKALQTMEQIRALTASALPAHCSYKMHAVPDIVLARFQAKTKGSNAQHDVETRENASNILATLSHFNSARLNQGSGNKNRDRSDSAKQGTRPTILVDDATFRTLLFEANVLGTKDHTKWSYDALTTLYNGVLQNPRRLEEAMRASKLTRRVLSFFHPYAMRYSTLQKNASNIRYTKLGCSIFLTLLTHPDGIKYLAEDRLLTELAECLETDIMSERRLHITIAGGYFEMIGVLSKSEEGLELMRDAQLFTALFRAMDNGSRSDLAKHLLDHLDFGREGHARILLGRILRHRSRHVRLAGAQRLDEMASKDSSRWIVRHLVDLLYDPSLDIRTFASNVLLRQCTRSTQTLSMVVSMRPMLDEGAHALLLKFLSTSHGFQYLMQGDYIDREMDEWFHQRNILYAIEVEVLASRAFSFRRGTDDAQLEWDGSVPPHFYGELVKTPEGRRLLAKTGQFAEFVHFVRQHADDNDDAEVLLKLKSILWVIGNIGASEGGVTFLEAENIVPTIVRIANTSQVYTLRGICFFVLSMIASIEQGAELIEDEGWTVAMSHSLQPDSPYGVCVPPTRFFSMPAWTPQVTQAMPSLAPPGNKLEREIVHHLASLGNAIVVAKATRTLKHLKERNPHLFVVPAALHEMARRSSASTMASTETTTANANGAHSSGMETPASQLASPAIPPAIELFVRALHLMATHPIRHSIRRYIWELFEARLDVALVQAMQECRTQLLASSRVNGHRKPESTEMPPGAQE